MIRDPSDGSVKPGLKTFDDLRAKYGPNWGLNVADPNRKPPKPAPTREELEAHYRQYNLAFKRKCFTAPASTPHESSVTPAPEKASP